MATSHRESATDSLTSRVSIKGSTRHSLSGARLLSATPSSQKVRISIYSRANPNARIARAQVTAQLSEQLPRRRHYLTGPEFEATFGADPADIAHIADWAKKKNLTVIESKAANRRVLVEGDVASINAAFGVKLNEYEHPTLGRFRGREGSVQVDPDLYGIIEGVFGLDTRRAGRPRMRRLGVTPLAWTSLAAAERSKGRAAPGNLSNHWPGTFFPPQVAALYDYPGQLSAAGQNVAVFAFNGGTDGDPRGGYSAAALNTYFTQVLGGSMPTIKDVVVQGPGNDPGPDNAASDRQGDATGEVMLDLCVVGSVAPAANIFVYFTEFTTQGWVDALQQAITDHNDIAIISISYGNPEDDPQGAWTAMGVKVVDQALQAAMAKGITICVASGDDGSGDGDPGAHVDFPASSPWVLAVGGTKLVAKGTSILHETVWNETRLGDGAGGGGVSVVFTKPDYQDNTPIPVAADPPHTVGRGVPDVAAVADPITGVVVMHVDGKTLEPIGGTSASAPLWASLIARLNQGIKARCGFINPLLYTKFNKGVLGDITRGNNGAYSAKAGWDACTGFGTPRGTALLKALGGVPKSSGGASKPAARKRR